MNELKQMMSEIKRNQNKESESYPTLCSLSTVHSRGKKGKTKRVFCNKKRKDRRKTLRRDINQKKMESMKRNIKNLSKLPCYQGGLNSFLLRWQTRIT